MIDWEAVEMSEIALRFPAWATGWMNLGTLKEFGVGGEHNFNLRIKKKSWSAESSVSCLESDMGNSYNSNFLFFCDWCL